MRKAAILASVIALTASTAYAADLEKMQTQMLGVSVQLNENCTGSIIYSDRDDKSGDVETLVLTAKHCVDGQARKRDQMIDVPVYQSGRVVKKDRFIATVKSVSYQSDLAVLELKDKDTFFEDVATIAAKDTVPKMGSTAYVVGFPLGMGLSINSGHYGALETVDYPDPGTEYARASVQIAGGNSGGSLFVESKDGYQIAGVVCCGRRDANFVGLYTPIEAIHDFLRTAAPGAIGVAKDDAEPVTPGVKR